MESSSSNATVESTTQNESEAGCGCSNITISVNPTTGGQFDLAVTKNDTIENLKKLISKKLKVPKERICLLHRERQLRDGTIQENQLVNGSRLTLLPSVETGLLAQRPEQSVMQALESLNDSQVNDFLSGKAPLNLTMRLGDHMMLIQLQLSTVTPNQSSSSSTSSTTTTTSSSTTSATSVNNTTSSNSSSPSPLTSSLSSTSTSTSLTTSSSTPSSSPSTSPNKRVLTPSKSPHVSPLKVKDPLASLTSIVNKSLDESPFKTSNTTNTALKRPAPPASSTPSPDKSQTPSGAPAVSASSPIPPTQTSSTASPVPSQSPSNPTTPNMTTNLPATTTSASSSSSPSASASSPSSGTGCKCDSTQHTGSTSNKPTLDTRALAEASRNLTQTLKQLSSEVLTSKSDPVEDVSTVKRRQGAIIESMHHHGKGVYSGTFSGTLNPALQDRFGRPKRDISTIIHILNDLLCATPQYRNARSSAATPPPDKTPSTSTPSQTTEVEMSNTGSVPPSAESLENQATRGKMERLRLIMEERREKRRAARSSPYARTQPLSSLNQLNHTQWSAKSETQRADQPNLPMDTDLCSQPEVSPEPVVA